MENDYKNYLKLICEKYHVTREEAEEMAIVKEVKSYLESRPTYTEE